MKRIGTSAARRAAHGSMLAVVLTVSMAVTHAEPLTAGAVVSKDAQAVRDDERVLILREELARELSRAADAAQRRIQSLGLHDSAGVSAADDAQRRAADNIAALRREIERASAGSASAPGLAAPASSLHTADIPHEHVARRVATTPSGAPPAWWDVYANAGRPAQAPINSLLPAVGGERSPRPGAAQPPNLEPRH